MTTAERPDIDDVERRLRSWMATGAGTPDLTPLYDSVVRSTRTSRQRRRLLVPRRNRRSTVVSDGWLAGRRLGLAAATVLVLTIAVIAGLLIGARLLRNHEPLHGLFRATGDIPTLAGSLVQPAVAVLPDGRILFAGAGDSILAGVVFDPATETYGHLIFDSVIRRGGTATTLPNGLILLAGGEFGQSDAASFTASLFDPASQTVAETNHLTVARSDHTATLLDDGRVLILGGRHYPGNGSPVANQSVVALDSAEIYDPATGTFAEIGPMNVPRAGHTATRLPDGTVLITGGYSTTQTGRLSMPTAAEIFDPGSDTFRLIGSMVSPRGHHTATVLQDGQVLLVGGADRYGPRGERLSYTGAAEVFDPKTETFTRVDPLVTERAGHSATLLPDGRVLIIGGANERGGPLTTEVYDPDTHRFERGPTATVAHQATVAPLLADGRVLAAGSGPGGSEVFDLRLIGNGAEVTTPRPDATGAFRPIATSAVRRSPQALRLRDGRILIVGSDAESGDDPAAAVEIFDPAIGTTAVGGRLPRSGYPSTQLRDGRVLFIASADDGSPVASYYDPSSTLFTAAPAVTKALGGGNLVGVSGLDDGRLIFSDGSSVTLLDPGTGDTTPPIPACESPVDIVPLDRDRVLMACANNADALVIDLAARTTEGTGLRFDRGIRLGDGRIALTTGGFGPNGDATRVSGVYDPVARAVTEVTTDLPVGPVVAASGGRLFAFGGTDEAPSDHVVEIDPTTGASRDVGPMLGRRSNAVVIALDDGRILILGGERVSPDRTEPVPPFAEVFDPSRIP